MDSVAAEADWHGIVTASLAQDLPGVPAPSPGQVRARLAGGPDGKPLTWLATADDRTAGVAALRPYPGAGAGEQRLAEAEVYVHPDWRGRGLGSHLLKALLAGADAEGRHGVVALTPACAPGELFCIRHGFTHVRTLHHLLLQLGEVHRVWLEELIATQHPGYRLVSWNGAVPVEFADALAAAKSALNDGKPRPLPQPGDIRLTVAAMRDGELAGFTELVVPAGATTRAQQHATAVLPGHRGHGVGVWLKAAMLRRLYDAFPQVNEIETVTAETNAAMLALNGHLGFRPSRRTHAYRLAIA